MGLDIDIPEVKLTVKEEKQYKKDYQETYKMYKGTWPSFEQYCRMRKTQVKRG